MRKLCVLKWLRFPSFLAAAAATSIHHAHALVQLFNSSPAVAMMPCGAARQREVGKMRVHVCTTTSSSSSWSSSSSSRAGDLQISLREVWGYYNFSENTRAHARIFRNTKWSTRAAHTHIFCAWGCTKEACKCTLNLSAQHTLPRGKQAQNLCVRRKPR